MKATEFVKKYGWSGFLIACKQRAIDRYKYTIIWSDEIGFSNEIKEHDRKWTFESNEVKTLVNAYELVKRFGGLQGAKDHLNHRREYGLYSLPKLKQAIELVESVK